jgi:hypothetical protein
VSIKVITGPLETAPAWLPSVVTFVRTRRGLRQIEEPRSNGSVADQVAAWIADKTLGGPPQYWQVDVTPKVHPEVVFELAGSDGVLEFRISLNYEIKVHNARLVLENKVDDLEGYFVAYLRREIAQLASQKDISEVRLLQAEIDKRFGGKREIADAMVEARHLTVQVRPVDEEVKADLKKPGQIQAKAKAIAADTAIKREHLKQAAQLTEGMTIQEFAYAVIMSNNPDLIGTYERLRAAQEDEGIRNRKTLEWLLANNVVEAHQIQKSLGLDDASIKRLAKSATGAGDDLKALPKL